MLALASAASAAAAALYSETLGYGFDYDDYHFIRPYSRAEVLAAFHGSWDATGIEVPFYRPLTVVFYALRFQLFGINAYPYHVLSVTLAAAAAGLAGWFAWRLSNRFAAGLAAAAVFIAHPALPYSLVAWVTNQMHGIEIVVVLSALAWWHMVRRRSVTWWIPLLALGAAAFLIKEDGIMLLPVICAIHVVTRRIDPADTPPLHPAFVVAAVVLLGGLFFARQEFLHGLGGYRRPSGSTAWRNVTKGLVGTFTLRPPDRPWQPFASWLAMVLPIAALIVWPRHTAGARKVIAAGACIAVLFDLPFVFVAKAEQMHLVALGAALVLAGSLLAIRDAVRGRAGFMIAGCVGAVLAVTFAVVTRDIARDFDPFGPMVRSHDDLVKDWAAVPQELRAYVDRKLAREPHLSPNPAVALPVVAFNLHLPESNAAGVRYRWMASANSEIHVTREAREITIPLRHEVGAFREPAHLVVRLDGRLVDELTLRDDQWRMSRFAVRAETAPRLRRMHRVELRLDRAWQPQRLIPGSQDTRTLGLQIGGIEVR